MKWQTGAFIGLMSALILGTSLLSYGGSLLPASSRDGALSLRNVQARRTHFTRYYAFGK